MGNVSNSKFMVWNYVQHVVAMKKYVGRIDRL